MKKKQALLLSIFIKIFAFGQDINVDMSKYQSGFFAIELISEINNVDTIICNECGGVKYNYPLSLDRIEIEFNFFFRKKNKNKQIKNIALVKKVKHKTIYYKNGLIINYNGKTFLIFQIGTPKELEISVEIDTPQFIKLLKNFETCIQ